MILKGGVQGQIEGNETFGTYVSNSVFQHAETPETSGKGDIEYFRCYGPHSALKKGSEVYT